MIPQLLVACSHFGLAPAPDTLMAVWQDNGSFYSTAFILSEQWCNHERTTTTGCRGAKNGNVFGGKRMNNDEIVTTRESSASLPEPWLHVAMSVEKMLFSGPTTVQVKRKNGKIIEISDAVGEMVFECKEKRRHGIITNVEVPK